MLDNPRPPAPVRPRVASLRAGSRSPLPPPPPPPRSRWPLPRCSRACPTASAPPCRRRTTGGQLVARDRLPAVLLQGLEARRRVAHQTPIRRLVSGDERLQTAIRRTAETLGARSAKRCKLLELHYQDRFSAELFADGGKLASVRPLRRPARRRPKGSPRPYSERIGERFEQVAAILLVGDRLGLVSRSQGTQESRNG